MNADENHNNKKTFCDFLRYLRASVFFSPRSRGLTQMKSNSHSNFCAFLRYLRAKCFLLPEISWIDADEKQLSFHLLRHQRDRLFLLLHIYLCAMHLYIKNMVCHRCILAVQQELEKLDIDTNNISLGEVEINGELSKETSDQLAQNLSALGFELLDDNKQQLIEKIKNIIIQRVHHQHEDDNHNLSQVIATTLHKDYSYLSSLFSDVEGITIEKYVINQKIEKVKELIIYDELSLSEIAYKLGYSSVAHLSNQFKKVTGLTPTHFKQVGQNKRKPLDQV